MPLSVILTGVFVGVGGLYILVVSPVLLWLRHRHMQRLQRGIEWQFTKMHKFLHEGWRPTLWDEGASEEEKREALRRYVGGDALDR